jgi:hypothetical protein
LQGETLELGAEILTRQADSTPPLETGVLEDLRDRLIRYLEAITGAGDGEACLPLDQLDTPRALAMWFGPSFAALAGKRSALVGALDRDIAAVDELICAQVNAILHAPNFQRLEGAWRGLQYVTGIAAEISGTKIRVLPMTWNEIARDLDRAGDFDQSQLFQKIYSEEFGTPGGEPFGLLIGDYAVQHQRTADHPTDDISALKSLASVASAAFAPIILGVSPSVFQLDAFSQLGRPIDLGAIFGQQQQIRAQFAKTFPAKIAAAAARDPRHNKRRHASLRRSLLDLSRRGRNIGRRTPRSTLFAIPRR